MKGRDSALEHLSRFLSLLLRHKPSLLGLWLDSDGFTENVNLSSLAQRLRDQRGFDWVTPDHIVEVVDSDPKQRYEIKNGKIRATYGHSVPFVEPLEHPTSLDDLPEVLYHGSTKEASEEILSSGLKPMGRRHVHLSRLMVDAEEVARRRTDEPVIIAVDTHPAVLDGDVKFRAATEDIFLASEIPPRYLYLVA